MFESGPLILGHDVQVIIMYMHECNFFFIVISIFQHQEFILLWYW